MTSDEAEISDEQAAVIRDNFDVQYAKVMTGRMIWMFVGLAGLLLAAYPVSTLYAGRQTSVNVNVAMTFAATMTLTTGGSLLALRYQRQELKRLKTRNRKLERSSKDMKKQLQALKET